MDERLRDLLDDLDRRDDAGAAADGRVSYRRRGVPLRVHHPGGTAAHRVVATRTLSPGGMAALHDGYLYANTVCEVALRRGGTPAGGEEVVRGRVASCRHVAGKAHEIAVAFDAPIDPARFAGPEADPEPPAAADADRAALVGHVLHLDDQAMDRALLAHHLSRTALKLTAVETVEEAIGVIVARGRMLDDPPVDVVLCDLNLADAPGERAIARLRDAGFGGPVAVLTAETSPARLAAAARAGAVGVVHKPYDAPDLLSRLAGWLGDAAAAAEPIVSTLPPTPVTAELVGGFVRTVGEQMEALAAAAGGGRNDLVRQRCVVLRGTAGGYGFAGIAAAAAEVVAALDARRDATAPVRRLRDVCARLRA